MMPYRCRSGPTSSHNDPHTWRGKMQRLNQRSSVNTAAERLFKLEIQHRLPRSKRLETASASGTESSEEEKETVEENLTHRERRSLPSHLVTAHLVIPQIF